MKKINFTSLFAFGLCLMGLLFSNSVQAQAPAGETEITINLGSGTFNAEISWELVNTNTNTVVACQTPGTFTPNGSVTVNVVDNDPYEFRAYDNYGLGDSWNGATVDIQASEDGSANGCGNPPMQELVASTVPGPFPTADQTNCLGAVHGGNFVAFAFSVACPDCELTCAPAITVNNDPGVCEAAVTVPQPTTMGNCASFSPVFTENFDAGIPAGWTNAGIGTNAAAVWMDGTAAANTPGGSVDGSGHIFFHDDDFDGDGGDIAQLTSTNIDLSAQAGNPTQLNFDYIFEDLGASFLLVEYSADGGTTWNTILNENTDPGCFGFFPTCNPRSVTAFPIPDADLTATFQVRFTYDDGNGWNWYAAVDNLVIESAVPPVATNDSPFGASPMDASGSYPVGTTTVTFNVSDSAGNPVNCTTDITVVDNEAPVLTVDGVDCAGGIAPQVINLDPGACSAVVDFVVEGTDNCPLVAPTINVPTPEGAPASAGTTGGGQGGIMFDVVNNGTDGLTIENWDIVLAAGVWQMQIYATTTATTYAGNEANGTPGASDANWTFLGVANVVSTGDNVFTNLQVSPLALAPGEARGIYITEDDTGFGGAPIVYFFNTPPNTYGDANLELTAGVGRNVVGGPFAGGVFGPTRRGQVSPNYAFAFNPTEQTAGLPSGSEFPIGTTVNTFVATDAAGNDVECTFEVTINEFANPISTLAVNDEIQVSLDEDGCSYVTADMVLEGGPYGCYEDYILTRTPAFSGSDAACPAMAGGVRVDCSDIGSEITVMITDPDTGNSAWSIVTVEDKLAPTIDCGDPIEVAACDGQAPPNFGAAPAPVTATGVSNDTGAFVSSTNNTPATATATVSGIPGNAVLSDVTVSVQISHTWVGDLDIDLVSPSGQTINLITGTCGANDDIDVVFSDAGLSPVCNAAAPTLSGVAMPEDALASFAGSQANGVWTLVVADGVGGDDGTIDGFSVTATAQLPFVPAPTATDNCDVDLTFVDNFFNLDCFDAAGNPDFAGRIERTWTATDGSGNTATCVQIINLTRPTLETIVFPQDITWQCDQFAEFPNITEATPLNPSITFDETVPALHVNPSTPDNLLANTGSGVATINGSPIIIGDLCEIACDFEDSTIEICPGTTKILRSWVCIDWCAGESVEFNQIIKVVDEIGPDLINPGDLEVDVFSASAPAAGVHTDCEGNPVVPAITDNGDNCSSIVSYETQIFSVDGAGLADELLDVIPTNGGQFFNIPLYDDNGDDAQYIVCYTAADECGNETEVCVNLTVSDKVPPVAVCDEITQLSITNSNVNGNSCSALAAEDLDDGSYDNCTDVHFLISRMNNPDPTSSQNIYTPFEDFCCEDIPGPVQVILLVLDDVAWNIYMNNVDDGNGNLVGYGQIQPDGQLGLRGNRLDLTSDDNGDPRDMDGRWNFCMVEVLVEDKLAPTIVCPPNDALTCDEYADDLAAALLACTDGGFAPQFDNEDECQSAALTAAGFGDVTGVDNCSVETTPTVTVTIDQCGAGSVVRSFSGVDPSGNPSNVCTQVITVTQVSDWVVEFPMDQDGFCDQDEPDFGEPEIFFETCELIATSFEDQFFDIVPDACFKIVRQWTVINWCVVGNVIDQEADAVELSEQQINQDLDGDGDRDSRTFRDSYRGVLPTSDNDPDADNQDGFITYQQVIKVQDFDAPVIDPTFSVDDLCIITGNDGTDDDFSDCAFSGVLPTPEYDDCTLDVNGNLDNNGNIVDNELTITATVFDANGDVVSNSVVVNGLEIGCYVVRYVAIDRCGNTVATDFDFCVNDCKFPTPYCKDGVVLELMHINDPNNTTFEPMVELWAADLDEGSFDNCPGGVQLSFSANVNDIGATFNCDNLGENAVQMWVTDASGNQDFCETFVIIQANQGQCPGDDPQVQGNVATETNLDVQDVTVAINTTAGFGDAQTTLADGNYNIEVPNNSDVTITPSKDMNPRNGVSTFDLVKISKHILNTESLDSPYKMIAADANNSGTITTLDLVQIRKLILFISDDFNNNSSWRFVDAAYNFPNPSNPWAEAFPEVISLNDVTPDALNNNFVAVKIGDVNGSAAANQLLGADDRNMTGALTLTAADVAMKAGETYTVEVSAANFNNFGYQFTMNFDADAMEFVSVGNGLATAENFGLTMLSEGAITASYYSADAVRVAADEAVFTLTFAAKADAQLSEVLSINSRYTAAEAYAANGDVQDVELDFNNGAAVAGFELYQNTPNPFATETAIGFNLGADKAATITISDISGKVVKVIEVDGVKGYNQVVLSRNEVAASGILYYQLDTDTDSATKKMILID